MRSGITGALILDLRTRWRCVVSFTLRLFCPRKEPSVGLPIEEEVGSAPAPVLTFWKRENSCNWRKSKHDFSASKIAYDAF
jgi:hypothetical protein